METLSTSKRQEHSLFYFLCYLIGMSLEKKLHSAFNQSFITAFANQVKEKFCLFQFILET